MADGVAITAGTGTTAAARAAGTPGTFHDTAAMVQTVEVGIVSSGVAYARPQTGTVTSVSDTASSTLLLSAGATRRGFRIFNHSPYRLYVKYAATASIAAGGWNVFIEPYTWLVEDGFGGRVDGIWAANGSGYAQIVELT
jgi:hypothetical protein